jgi:hypothetical protein
MRYFSPVAKRAVGLVLATGSTGLWLFQEFTDAEKTSIRIAGSRINVFFVIAVTTVLWVFYSAYRDAARERDELRHPVPNLVFGDPISEPILWHGGVPGPFTSVEHWLGSIRNEPRQGAGAARSAWMELRVDHEDGPLLVHAAWREPQAQDREGAASQIEDLPPNGKPRLFDMAFIPNDPFQLGAGTVMFLDVAKSDSTSLPAETYEITTTIRAEDLPAEGISAHWVLSRLSSDPATRLEHWELRRL